MNKQITKQMNPKQVVSTGALRHRVQRKSTQYLGNGATSNQSRASVNLIAVGAGFISFTTVFLILLGFGVSLAVETTFGMPHSTVFDSTLELVDLSSIAVMELLSLIIDAWESGPLYAYLAERQGTYLYLAVGGLFLSRPATLIFKRWIKQSRMPETPKPVSLFSRKMAALKNLWREAVLGILIMASPLILVCVISIPAVLLSIIPTIGMSLGQAYFNQWVIGPGRCKPLENLETLRKKSKIVTPRSTTVPATRIVSCIALKKDQSTIAIGRVVVSTSQAVILVDESGVAKRILTEGLAIEVVDALSSD